MTKGPFMEFLRGRVVETTINTWIENAIPVPTSRTELMAMLIHEITFWQQVPQEIAATLTESLVTVADRSYPAGLVWPDTPGIIVHNIMWRKDDKGTWNENHVVKFDPPLLYTKREIYLGARGVDSTAQLIGMLVRIGYTLEKVSREDFISALVE